MCWKDPSYRRARRHGQATTTLIPAAEIAPLATAGPAPRSGLYIEPEPLVPADIITGTGRNARYPWDEDRI
jgi:hypothetical protein